MNTIGQIIKITFFGESHGEFLGVVIDQLPAGIKINIDLIKENLSKRRPKSKISTKRIEKDDFKIVSGFKNGFSTGAALTFLVKNENTKPNDYQKNEYIPRPSHADYPAYVKYNNFNDKSGGGIFSGRLTVLWVIVGSICQQILQEKNIFIASHIKKIANVEDKDFSDTEINETLINSLQKSDFPLINSDLKELMINKIEEASKNEDSVGGIIESTVINSVAGLGEPLFLSVESYLSQLLFAIPGIKGIEFGKGFKLSDMLGSEANDEYIYDNNELKTLSNNNGGILGGITTGEPILLKVAVKPTSSIGKSQKSVNLKTKNNVDLEIVGRHDPQIVSRVLPVVNAVINFAILDLLLLANKKDLF